MCKIKRIMGAWIILLFLSLNPATVSAFGNSDWAIDGFVRNNTGVWTKNWDYSESDDPLATCRNWLRLNVNGSITDSLYLKAEVLGVYEPDYPRERGSGLPANEYNYFDFRELRLDWTPSDTHTISVGRQIVNWGEAISARVGDVINPQDTRFDLGFTNLEDTRMPIWMIRGLHELSFIRSSVDWIYSPYMEPDRYRVNRTPSSIGTVNSDGSFMASPRFAAYPETRNASEDWAGKTAFLPMYAGTSAGANYFLLAPASVLPLPTFGPPFSNVYANLDGTTAAGLLPFVTTTSALGATVTPGVDYNPYAPSLYSYDGVNFLAAPALTSAYPVRAPNVTTNYPGSGVDDARWGFKTSTAVAGWQTGVYYWYSNELSPVLKIKGGLPAAIAGAYNIVVDYPRQAVYGLYGNKNFDFGVLRLDAAVRPNRDFCSLDYADNPDGTVEKDHLVVQLGFNKDVMWRELNPNSPFSFTFEYVLESIFGDQDGVHVPGYFIRIPKDLHTFFLSAGTNYNFGMYAYNVTVIYNARNNGLWNPSFTYKPDWLNGQISFKVAYTDIFGDSNYDYPYGLFREKDMVVFTAQYDFDWK